MFCLLQNTSVLSLEVTSLSCLLLLLDLCSAFGCRFQVFLVVVFRVGAVDLARVGLYCVNQTKAV